MEEGGDIGLGEFAWMDRRDWRTACFVFRWVPASAGMTGVWVLNGMTGTGNDGVLNGVLCFSLDSRLRGNDGGVRGNDGGESAGMTGC